MAEKTIQESNVPARVESDPLPTTREPERYLIPAVDIFETEEGLSLLADLPGVSKDGLDVRVEDDVLTISGKVSYTPREGGNHEEFRLLDYHRQFRLSDMVDQEKIQANLRNGVLTLALPKAEKAKPKKIDVKVG